MADEGDSKNELKQIEYIQVSEDWRHRDSLTWQMPTALVVAGGVLIAEAFNLPDQNVWLRPYILLAAFGLAASLTVALWQNLDLQRKNRTLIQKLYPGTERFGFARLGSGLLLALSTLMSVFLAVVAGLAMFGQV